MTAASDNLVINERDDRFYITRAFRLTLKAIIIRVYLEILNDDSNLYLAKAILRY